ncbi:r3H domain-containing protein [Phthorimaea operculella]|nr:r3H domain-containing protein [Phthorimaea operculella]
MYDTTSFFKIVIKSEDPISPEKIRNRIQRSTPAMLDVNDDLKYFLAAKHNDSVLVFPPVSNYRRFLIHRCVEDLGLPELTTFSIGVNQERRTVVCFKNKLLSDEACAQPTMGLRPTEHEDETVSQPCAAVVGGCKSQPARRAQPQEKISEQCISDTVFVINNTVSDCRMSALELPEPDCLSGTSKPRRPDRAVYVPRALRAAESSAPEESKPTDTKRPSQSDDNVKCPKSPSCKEKSTHGTPRKSIDKTFCNVYTPPHLRNQTSHSASNIEHPIANDTTESAALGSQVPNCDSATTFSDNCYNDIEVGENFYIGDYFANGQLGFYAPSYYSEYVDAPNNGWRTNEMSDNMALNKMQQNNIIDKDYLYNKDEDVEKNELKRASQEINRSSKRIIKQSFDSDVLVISDPADETTIEAVESTPPDEKLIEPKKTKPKLEAKVSLKREENDWDTVFDDSGECLDPSLLEELTSTVGKVHISKAKNNYEQYQTKGQALFNGPFDEAFAHVIEVYDFPSEFKTNDLLSLFSEYKDTGFEIKWVDDTHALIVFSSAKIAGEVLATQRPLARCRPLHSATLESRNKAKKCAEFLQPYRQRPETCTALARRLVSGALGVKLSTARQERAEERRLITIAREKKRQAALHKEAAWDGSLTNQSLSET